MRSHFILFSAALVCSCSQMAQEQQLSERKISVNVVEQATKTALSGSSIQFESGDRLRLICEDYNELLVSNANTGDVNSFEGSYFAKEISGTDCSWYAVYPTSLKVNETGIVSGSLPENQNIPFDPSANYMYSGIQVADYNEADQPNLTLSMSQIMGLVRITFVNKDSKYENDKLKSVQLSASTPLSGSFTFDIHHPENNAVFSGSTSQHVGASYSIKTPLGGEGDEHTLYLFVNPATITNATLNIRTDKHSFTYTSTHTFIPRAGALTTLPTMDLKDFEVEDLPYKKTVACWGNSYTSRNSIAKHDAPNEANYPDHLQALLGEDWFVYNGGYNGWTLPAIIEKLEEWEEQNEADLTILYMERNGGFNTWQDCLDQYNAAISHLTNRSDYIVLGAHLVQYWSERDLFPYSTGDYRVKGGTTYEGTFLSPFIESGKYKDLLHPVIQDWKKWLVRVGKYDSIEDISDEVEYPGGVGVPGAVMIDSNEDGIKDKALEWPQSFRWATSDVHPSKWGAKAMAYMVYDRMYDLGYVDSPALPAL